MMNWVGGSRQRLKKTEDEKKKKDFFEKQRQHQRLTTLDSTKPTKSLDLISIKTVDKVNKNPWHLKVQGHGKNRAKSHVIIGDKSRANHVEMSPETNNQSHVHIGQYKHPKDILNKALRGPVKVPSWTKLRPKPNSTEEIPSSSSGLDALFGNKTKLSQKHSFLDTKTPHPSSLIDQSSHHSNWSSSAGNKTDLSQNSSFLDTKTPHSSSLIDQSSHHSNWLSSAKNKTQNSPNHTLLDTKTPYPSSFVDRTPCHPNRSSSVLEKNKRSFETLNRHSDLLTNKIHHRNQTTSPFIDRNNHNHQRFVDKRYHHEADISHSSYDNSAQMISTNNTMSRIPHTTNIKRKNDNLSASDLFNEMPEFGGSEDTMTDLERSYHNGYMFNFSKGSASRPLMECDNLSAKKRKSNDSGLGDDITHNITEILNSPNSHHMQSRRSHQVDIPAMQPGNSRHIPKPRFLDMSGSSSIGNDFVNKGEIEGLQTKNTQMFSSIIPGMTSMYNEKEVHESRNFVHKSDEHKITNLSRDSSVTTFDGSRDLFADHDHSVSYDRSFNRSSEKSFNVSPNRPLKTSIEFDRTQIEDISSSLIKSQTISTNRSPIIQREYVKQDIQSIKYDNNKFSDEKYGEMDNSKQSAHITSSFLQTYYAYVDHCYVTPSLPLKTLMDSMRTLYFLRGEILRSDVETQTVDEVADNVVTTPHETPSPKDDPREDSDIVRFDDSPGASELVIIETSQTHAIRSSSENNQKYQNYDAKIQSEMKDPQHNQFENFVDDHMACDDETNFVSESLQEVKMPSLKSVDRVGMCDINTLTQIIQSRDAKCQHFAKVSSQVDVDTSPTPSITSATQVPIYPTQVLTSSTQASTSPNLVTTSSTEISPVQRQSTQAMIWPDERMFFEKLPILPLEDTSVCLDITDKMDINMINKRQTFNHELDTSNLVLRIANKKPENVTLLKSGGPKFVPKFTSSQAIRRKNGSAEQPIISLSQNHESPCISFGTNQAPIFIDDTPEPEYTPPLMPLVEKNGKQSPFLIVGRKRTKSKVTKDNSDIDKPVEPHLKVSALQEFNTEVQEVTDINKIKLEFTHSTPNGPKTLSQSNPVVEHLQTRVKRHLSEPIGKSQPRLKVSFLSQPCLEDHIADCKKYKIEAANLDFPDVENYTDQPTEIKTQSINSTPNKPTILSQGTPTGKYLQKRVKRSRSDPSGISERKLPVQFLSQPCLESHVAGCENYKGGDSNIHVSTKSHPTSAFNELLSNMVATEE